MHILAVAIKSPLYSTFDYHSEKLVSIGCRIIVNFAGKELIAIVLEIKESSNFKTKEIIQIIDEKPIFDEKILFLIRWCANYYIQPIGEVIFASIPKKLRIGKELIIKKLISKKTQINSKIKLNIEQQLAVDIICKSLNQYQAFLLYGITGSGKTEVYLQIAKQVLNNGKQVLVLVPEIGLTKQTIDRFAYRLDTEVVAIHSSLNVTQKLDSFLMAKNIKCGVVLGTRSAIWTQIPNLGLIIIDEEHDTSFKQLSSPRYSAKNLAFIRAKNENIPIILGSATPSLESLKLLIDKKLTNILLKNRASGVLPKVEIIDTKLETEAISSHLQQKIKQHLNNDKQVILFINRRGYAPIYFCTSCNWQATCSACEKPLIYHSNNNKLKCHSCDSSYALIHNCGNCNASTLQVMGYGTQRLEENLGARFNGIDIIRIDRDSTAKKAELNKKLDRIKTGKPAIIIGTQMLTKGHNFDKVSLVGVLNVDGSLLSSSFRATEYLIQLLIQVSGRSGRADDNGEVVIQTKFPEHPIFNFTQKHNYAGYIKTLLVERKNSLMPPFAYSALICANCKTAENAKNYLSKCREILMRIEIEGVNIFSVITSNPPKKANYYYYQLNLYSQNRNKLGGLLQTFLKNMPKQAYGVRWFIDIDSIE